MEAKELGMMATNFLSSFEESNPTKTQAIESWRLANVDSDPQSRQHIISFRNSTSFYHISLPDTRRWQAEFKTKVLLMIVDHDMKEYLVKNGLINWCHNVRSMMPVNVPKDGNSLLHAASLAVWGIYDNGLMLRRLLCLALGIDHSHRFQDRWLHQRQRQITQFVDRLLECGTELVDKEWAEIRQCLEPERLQSLAAPHRSLEPIHVYVLANILRRPVIVLADPLAHTLSSWSLQDSEMGGVYLPLEWSWMDTCRVPIFVAYRHGHFCPLLFGDHPDPTVTEVSLRKGMAPLVNRQFEQLSVRFLLQEEEPEAGNLLRKYLKVRETVMQVDDRVQNVLCAELEMIGLPEELNIVTDYILDCVQRHHQETELSCSHLHGAVVNAEAGATVKPLQLSVSKQPLETAQTVRKEHLQGAHPPQYGLRDPTLCPVGGGEHQLHIPPPSLVPERSFAGPSLSLRPPAVQKCRVPGCNYYGDPDLAMMCSKCFRNYTIRESRAHPSAPLAWTPAEGAHFPISMMKENCKENCGYRCSTKTYPYCHECASKRQKQTQEESLAAAFKPATVVNERQKSSAPSGSGSGHQKVLESGEVAGNAPLDAMSGAHCTPPMTQPPARTGDQTEADPSSQNAMPSAAAQTLEEAQTRAMVTGDPTFPPQGAEEEKAVPHFNSGEEPPSASSNGPAQEETATGEEPQAAPSQGLAIPTSTGAHNSAQLEAGDSAQSAQQTQSSGLKDQQHALSAPGQELSSAAALAKNQLTSAQTGEAKAACANEECAEKAVHNGFCGKCYVSQGVKSAGLPGSAEEVKVREAAGEQNMKMMSSLSSSWSAPPSVESAAALPKSNATYTKEAGAFPALGSRNQPSSLTDLRNIPSMNYTHSWIHDNRFVPGSGPVLIPTMLKSPPQGLPEKPESEPLGNDLIASGAECYSSTQRCIAEGCGNAVPQARSLCRQCQDILRHARQGQAVAASGQAAQGRPRDKPCVTEGCPYFGIEQNLGYCSKCYGKHVERELEEKSRHGGSGKSANQRPPLPGHRPSGTINVPPEFHFVHTPSERQGEPCASAGCRLFGDPEQAGMCFTHYQQHLATIAKATRRLAPSKRPNKVTTIPYASVVNITPSSVTVVTPGDVFPPRQVSVSPPLAPAGGASLRSQEPSLGETYYRVASRYTGNCLNPTCTNYGNRSRGGLCNSCAEEEKANDDLISRAVYGDEETG